MADNHEQPERAHGICLASHQRIISAIEFPLAAHELLFSPHIFVWERGHSELDIYKAAHEEKRQHWKSQNMLEATVEY